MDRHRLVIPAIGTGVLFLAIQLGTIGLLDPFAAADYQVVENPNDPVNSFLYVGAVLLATVVIFGLLKYGQDWMLRVIVACMSGLLALYVLSVLVPPLVSLGEVHVLAWLGAAVIAAALYGYPEWYVIDAAGILMGAGAAGLFGISFGPLPALLMLIVLGLYDAISVYRTEHMLSLAENVTDLKLPLILIVPVTLDYSFLEADMFDEDEQREAFFLGLGDAVIPTILVGSAAVFHPVAPVDLLGFAIPLPAFMAMIGTLVGLALLLWLVTKGRAHAGLPLLNGGAIGGYLMGAAVAGISIIEALGLGPYV